MKKFLNLFFSLLASIFINQAYAYSLNNKVTGIIIKFMQENHISGAAAAIIEHNKKIIYVFGKTNRGKIMPITDKTSFELGSITKVITTLLLSQEIQNRELLLTNSMTDYLSQYSKSFNLKEINLEQLATHTSGLPFNKPQSVKTNAQLEYYLLHWKPKSPTQMIWQYSNMGIGLLGQALSAKNHQSIDVLFDTIFLYH